MKEIGKKIVEGVWDGITGLGSWFSNKISGFFNGMVGGILNGIKGKANSISNEKSKMGALDNQNYELNNERFNLDNIALSGSYYTVTTRDSLNANSIIKQVNGSAMAVAQTAAFDSILGMMTDFMADIKDAMLEMNNSTIIMKNYMDSEEISSYTYKKIDNKLALAGRSRR